MYHEEGWQASIARGDARTGKFGMVGHHVPAASVHVALSATETPQLWHRRYGYFGYDHLAKLAETGLVKGMTTSAAEFKTAGKDACSPCIRLAEATGATAH